ncbi:C40 family peptidase [Pseudomonas sp. RIT-PI-AD]|uniref:C40 family peptidase n=1 Tax=Pseudomonas sp. RIT-PI-AD TaxID=3035294 RepID=UPI0021D92818|nr:C40 family peptidase [Pseudomonas sp. RIT-PI-AD]
MRKHIVNAIREHAAADYPREACGIIVANGRRQEYVRCRNVAVEASEEFRLAPEDYAEAEERGRVIGIVHTHPDASSKPSAADRAHCEASGLPWHILSWPEGDLRTLVPSGEIPPLEGRTFVHGVWDCYAIVRDWYRLERGITLPDYPREDGWWERGENLYMRFYEDAGFHPVEGRPQVGDVIIMQIRAAEPNHAAIYLGDGQILHHLHGRLSQRDIYGGYWAERTRLILRHGSTEDVASDPF